MGLAWKLGVAEQLQRQRVTWQKGDLPVLASVACDW
jgi:hypothetical protein